MQTMKDLLLIPEVEKLGKINNYTSSSELYLWECKDQGSV